jgi:hypothetical protein
MNYRTETIIGLDYRNHQKYTLPTVSPLIIKLLKKIRQNIRLWDFND